MSKTYEVKKNDTLSKIAVRYGVTVSDIQKANSSLIKDVNKIKVGLVLTIPEKTNDAFRKQFETALKDIEKLSSVKKLCEMLG